MQHRWLQASADNWFIYSIQIQNVIFEIEMCFFWFECFYRDNQLKHRYQQQQQKCKQSDSIFDKIWRNFYSEKFNKPTFRYGANRKNSIPKKKIEKQEEMSTSEHQQRKEKILWHVKSMKCTQKLNQIIQREKYK